MKKFRLARDLGLLLLGGFMLFGVITLINMFDGESENEKRSEFSSARRVAELAIKREDWKVVIASNQKLVEQDPYNSHAWYDKAMASFRIVKSARDELKDLAESAADDAKSAAEEKVNQAVLASRDHFLACLDFARYRNLSRIYLAFLESLLGDDEKALDYLELAVQDGFYNRQYRIGGIGFFRSLNSNPRFKKILEMEQANKSRRPSFKLPQVRRN